MSIEIEGSLPNRVFLFDTTLRDGEQASGKLMPGEKLRIARMLENAGIDIIEAGFPVSSQGDFDAVALVAKEIQYATVCALSRAVKKDIEVAACAIKSAKYPRIHTFIATSDIHMKDKLHMSREQVLALIHDTTLYARSYVDDVEFSMEDATRSDLGFLSQAIAVAIQAGARTINIPDTVGYSTPWSYTSMIRSLYKSVPELKNVTLSVHCHNDLGLGVANSLAGIREGARQVEGCFLGLGERAGNAAIEEIAMNIHEHSGEFNGAFSYFNPAEIGNVSRTVAEMFGYTIPPHKALVGSKVFAHSSGIHSDGVNKNPQTYEIITPASVGWSGISTELKSHIGRNGLSAYLKKMGYDGEKLVEKIYPKFIEFADAKRRVSEGDLRMLVHKYMAQNEVEENTLFHLKEIFYGKGSAEITLSKGEHTRNFSTTGNGAVDALWKAILCAVKSIDGTFGQIVLTDYQVVKGEGGSEANAWVVVRVRLGDKEVQGHSGDPDTVVATAKAFVHAINHLSL